MKNMYSVRKPENRKEKHKKLREIRVLVQHEIESGRKRKTNKRMTCKNWQTTCHSTRTTTSRFPVSVPHPVPVPARVLVQDSLSNPNNNNCKYADKRGVHTGSRHSPREKKMWGKYKKIKTHVSSNDANQCANTEELK